MAIVAHPLNTRLTLVFEDSVDSETGEIKLKSLSFGTIADDAENEDLHAVAEALAGLQVRVLHAVRRVDNNELADE